MLNIVYSKYYQDYNFGPGHPFIADRAEKFLKLIKKTAILFKIIHPKRALDKDILLVHSLSYLERLKAVAKEKGFLAPDTPVAPDILEAAFWSVGGSILALNLALQKQRVMNLLGGMHHTGIYSSSGFCIFNDHAIAIRKLQKEKKIKKALVIDLDVHAGQGTQEIFYYDPMVFTISIHQDPTTLYPGTGFLDQIGEGKGRGYNLNFPLPPGTEEKEYLKALDKAISISQNFSYDVAVLVFGVDTYKEDPLAEFRLDQDSYEKIGKKFRSFPKLAIMCAGGYSKETPSLWLSFLQGFL